MMTIKADQSAFYSGTKRSPHVRTAIMLPTKNPIAVATLIFPGSFSGEKTSVRKNLENKAVMTGCFFFKSQDRTDLENVDSFGSFSARCTRGG